jgi:hypothetical protein
MRHETKRRLCPKHAVDVTGELFFRGKHQHGFFLGIGAAEQRAGCGNLVRAP